MGFSSLQASRCHPSQMFVTISKFPRHHKNSFFIISCVIQYSRIISLSYSINYFTFKSTIILMISCNSLGDAILCTLSSVSAVIYDVASYATWIPIANVFCFNFARRLLTVVNTTTRSCLYLILIWVLILSAGVYHSLIISIVLLWFSHTAKTLFLNLFSFFQSAIQQIYILISLHEVRPKCHWRSEARNGSLKNDLRWHSSFPFNRCAKYQIRHEKRYTLANEKVCKSI